MVSVTKKTWEENVFDAATADCGRGCDINSFVFNMNLNMNIASSLKRAFCPPAVIGPELSRGL